MIIGYIGTMGRGKTVSSVFTARLIKEQTSIDYIVANFHVEFADEVVSSPRELEERSKYLKQQGIVTLYILDEIWAWMDARESMENSTMTDFVLNSRKRLGVIIYTTQDLSQPDKRLTENTDFIGICRHVDGVPGAYNDTQYVYIFKRSELGDLTYINLLVFNPEPMYGQYDTKEEVAGVSKAEQYEDIIEEYKERVASGEFEYKNELFSELHIEEDISKSDAEAFTNKIFNELKNEGVLEKSKQQRLGGD